MKTVLRRFADTGKAEFGWLRSAHSFSFGLYHDRRWMGFGALRVINNDHVAPKSGFDPHPHQEMEIITYVLSGTLRHGDSFGNNGATIPAGSLQLISAGRGMMHSEHNPSADEPVHLLQIWIKPNTHGDAPSYQQLPAWDEASGVRLVVSPDGADGSMHIKQDARLYIVRLRAGEQATVHGRAGWVQQVRGQLSMADTSLDEGDGLGIDENNFSLEIKAITDAECLFFDLPPISGV